MGILLASESHVTRPKYNINQCSRPFLRIPCWLVFLPCSLPTDSWLLIIIPAETKRNFHLRRAAWTLTVMFSPLISQQNEWVATESNTWSMRGNGDATRGPKKSITKRKPGLTYSSSPAFGLSLSDGRSLKERLRRSLSKKVSCRASKIVNFGLSCRGCSHFFNS